MHEGQPILGEIAIRGNDLVQINPVAFKYGGQKQIFLGTFTDGEEFVLQQYFPTASGASHGERLLRGREIDGNTKDEMLRESALTAKIESTALSMGVPSPVPHIYGPVNDREGKLIGVAAEFIPGETLRDRLPKITPTEAFSYMRQLVRAISVFEKAGIVHRDLDLGNIIVDRQGQIRILDLGIALVDGENTPPGELLRQTNGMGKLEYVAPETRRSLIISKQEYKTNSANHQHVQTDMYVLGVSFWELLTKQSFYDFLSPHHGADYQLELSLLDENTAPERLSRIDEALFQKNITFQLRKVVLRMLQYRQEDRYEDTQTLEHELEAAIEDYSKFFCIQQHLS